jgi:hypothetical protein
MFSEDVECDAVEAASASVAQHASSTGGAGVHVGQTLSPDPDPALTLHTLNPGNGNDGGKAQTLHPKLDTPEA